MCVRQLNSILQTVSPRLLSWSKYKSVIDKIALEELFSCCCWQEIRDSLTP